MSIKERPVVEKLSKHHDRESFSCGVQELDTYIRKQASQDSRRKVARVFVATLKGRSAIAGYYTLSAASIELSRMPEKIQKKLPKYPVPVARIGRLAVDKSCQGIGLGSYLLMDALNRIIAASEVVAIFAVIVEATNDSARGFYEKYGFISLPENARRMVLPLETIGKCVT